MGGHIEGKRRLVALARWVDDSDWHAVHLDRVGGLQRADHEGDQVGRQWDGVSEHHPVGAVANRCTGCLGPVGHGQQIRVHDQRDPECGLEVRFVEAREGTAGVGGLELGGGDGVLRAVQHQGAPVETPEAVIEDPGEGQFQADRPRG